MKDLFKQIWSTYSSGFFVIGTIASIVGLALIGINDPYRSNIALSLVCLFLFLTFLKTLSILNSFLRQDFPSGYITDSSFVRYITRDGNIIEYEIYKYIQCKKLILDEHKYGYCWSGTQAPEIRSDLQKLDRITKSTDGTYDSAYLKFSSPLKYNDCETIHVHMKLDDSDKRSIPYLESRITSPMKLLRWRVELHHKNNDYKGAARFLKKKIAHNFNHPYEVIKTIPFDLQAKAFDVCIPRPDIGYYYRLEWDK